MQKPAKCSPVFNTGILPQNTDLRNRLNNHWMYTTFELYIINNINQNTVVSDRKVEFCKMTLWTLHRWYIKVTAKSSQWMTLLKSYSSHNKLRQQNSILAAAQPVYCQLLQLRNRKSHIKEPFQKESPKKDKIVKDWRFWTEQQLPS